MLVLVLGLCAAVLLALGFVIQQHAAARAPAEERLSLRLLFDLAHRPLWLAGIAAMVGGQILGAVALDHGSLTLVEPLLAANLLFALPMAAAWTRKSLGPREWAGAVILMAGLATFVVAAGPSSDQASKVSSPAWLIAGLTIVAVVMGLVWFGKRTDLAEEATLLAAGAGILYGLQDGLTQRTLLLFPHGIVTLLTSWLPYSLVAVAIAGLLLAQSAFEAAPLAASLPAITIAEPITGIGLGAGLFSQDIGLSPQALAFEMVGIALMIIGVYLVARSPVVTGQVAEEGHDTRRAA
ncbi:MAG: DMT family transporter [Acidimicrobiales bacterium]